MKIALVGAGAFAREAAEVASEKGYQIQGVFADFEPNIEYNWLGKLELIDTFLDKLDGLFFAISAVDRKSINIRGLLIQKMGRYENKFVNLISSKAIVSQKVRFGKNVYVAPGAVINTGAQLGDFVLVNNNTTIGHDVELGNNCIISGNGFIGGNSRIGKNSLVGPGANILQNLQIGDGVIVSVGATVLKSLADKKRVFPTFNKIIQS